MKPEIHLIKEKIIYMVPDKDGVFKELKLPKINNSDLTISENEKKFEMEQILHKKVLKKTNKGNVDRRNNPSEKQLAALAAAREKRDFNRNEKKKQNDLKMKQQIKETLIDVVTQPSADLVNQKKQNEINRKKYEIKKSLDLFS